jgi:hypothetical protein
MMEFFKAIHLGIEAERTVNRECRDYSFSQTTESHRLSFFAWKGSRFFETHAWPPVATARSSG